MQRRSRLPARILALLWVAVIGAGSLVACGGEVPPPAAPREESRGDERAPRVTASGEALEGEVVIVLEAGATPPGGALGWSCAPGRWASETTLVVRCERETADASFEQLLEGLRGAPGVRSADPNYVRTRR